MLKPVPAGDYLSYTLFTGLKFRCARQTETFQRLINCDLPEKLSFPISFLAMMLACHAEY